MSAPNAESVATSTAHPFPVGTRVRHDGRRYSIAAFATVLEVKPQRDRTFEYRVAVDADSGWVTAGQETWWASYHTWGAQIDTSGAPS